MKELIYKDDAIDALGGEGLITAMVIVDRLQSVDAEPVRHGRWIDTGSGEECSECGEIQYSYDNFRHYCANCGAKMDLEGFGREKQNDYNR